MWRYNASTIMHESAGLGRADRFLLVCAALAAFLFAIGGRAHAATLTVVNTNDSGAGSLRQAIADAALGDSIDFAPALSGQTITLTTGELLIAKDLSITGPAGGIEISGNHASRVFKIDGGANVALSSLVISHGWHSFEGGGILNKGASTLTLIETSVTLNEAGFGAGIRNQHGVLNLIDSTVSHNNADLIVGNGESGGILNNGTLNLTRSSVVANNARFYGGIHSLGPNLGDATATLVDSVVSENTALYQVGGIGADVLTLTNSSVNGNRSPQVGGMAVDSLTMNHSTVRDNHAHEGAGGMTANGVVIDSTISGNTADYAAGVSGWTLVITNSTISGNIAVTAGGGLYNSGGAVTLKNTTITGNSAASGGGFWTNGGVLTLESAIIGDQLAGGDCANPFNALNAIVSLGYNLDSDGSCNLTAGGDLPNTDPLLDPLALNAPGTTQTHALQVGSPAIDHIPSGVNGCGTIVTTDQRGLSRPQGSGCDIGAYELLAATIPNPMACSKSSGASQAAEVAKAHANLHSAVHC